jgi:alkylation response protein AidB-like acyl-CoA dehydrogenase
MPNYTPPLRDFAFVLHEALKIDAADIPGYADLDRDFTAAILGEAGKIASEVLAPLNLSGDRQGCVLENGVVRTPEGFKAAFDTLREGGWTGLDCDPDYGGQGMPYVLATAVGEMHCAANMAFMMYPGLTHGAYSAIHAHGSEDQKRTYLPKMVAGAWTGTMNLTEPHCGTDLGLLRTRAEPQDDGSY